MSRRPMWPLLPLVPVYGAAQAIESLGYARGWRRVERLSWPVISVGNLSVGGAGKTPFVIALTQLLTERGWAVDVLSRGYGRASDAVERVVMNGADDPATRYGDEPWLIAQTAEAPVFVGRSRAEAGRFAERSLEGAEDVQHVHLLDDGMQHRRLGRDAEIVLLHRSDFETMLLPAGRLREPLAALERADFVVLRDGDAGFADRARRWMREDAQIWTIRRQLVLPELPGPAVVFSTIAHPDEFVMGLRDSGVRVAAIHAWRDHHRFTAQDLTLLQRMAKQHRAACFLTTEKDDARLTPAQRVRLNEAAAVLTARLTVSLVDSNGALMALQDRLRSASKARAAL